MNNVLYLLSFFALSIMAQEVEIHGALRSIMQGDLKSKFDLTELEGKANLYGLGAIADLKGEVIVINSKPYISQVVGKEIKIDSTFNHRASLFAFKQINSWVSDTILESINSASLEKVISKKVIDQQAPLSFFLTAKAQSLNWHIIDWQKEDTVHTHQKHKNAGIHGQLKGEDVIIFGFYSENHKGVLTHKNSNLHMHFINNNKTISGHVDDLILETASLHIASK